MFASSRKTFLATAIAAVSALGCSYSAWADTTVRILRVEISQVEKDYYTRIGEEYEKNNPGVDIQFDYISNEAYKSKLPTMLQSSQRPEIFYSWGGEALRDKAEAGLIKDLTDEMEDGWKDTYPESAVKAFTIDGKIFGAPLYATEVGFWTNTSLTEKAGVDVSEIDTWDDFLGAANRLKDEGVTPIVVGGKDGWPMHFYWGYLATRLAGAEGVQAAMDGNGDGFVNPAFVEAGEKLQELVSLDPFQPGFMTTTYERASGMFGDGKAAFHLMGDWDYLPSKQRSVSGEGVPDEDLVFMSFPTVEGGAGNEATFGGLNGFAVTKNAPQAAVDFLRTLLNAENQREAARLGIFVPVAKGVEEDLATPYARKVAEDLAASSYHQVFFDQALGTSVGATVNDISTDLAQEVITPVEAAERVEEAWQFR